MKKNCRLFPIIVLLAHLCMLFSSCDNYEFVDDENPTSSQFPYRVGVVNHNTGSRISAFAFAGNPYSLIPTSDVYEVHYDRNGNLSDVEYRRCTINFTNMRRITVKYKDSSEADTVYVTYNNKGYATLLKYSRYYYTEDKSDKYLRISYVQIDYDDNDHIVKLTDLPLGGDLIEYSYTWEDDNLISSKCTTTVYESTGTYAYGDEATDNKYRQNVMVPVFLELVHPHLSTIMAYLGLFGKGPKQLVKKSTIKYNGIYMGTWESTSEPNYELNDDGTISKVGTSLRLYYR